jgi:gamma-glutamylcyclotransferase (GGCT)/AIG2-like uncharacterized protein YtfP
MCVIIIKDSNKVLGESVLRRSSKINPHGLGVVWLDTWEITYHKSREWQVLNTDRPFIAHFRFATVGVISKDNTHPFQCGVNQDEWLMQNGTIPNMGNVHDTDTKVMARKLGFMPRRGWKKELEKYNCRFVTVNTRTKSYEVYNRRDWIRKDGVLYSKANVFETNRIAVYGTLKYGLSNYRNYLTESSFAGSGVTKEKYPLIIKGLPYMIKEKGKGHNVEVDVFNVDDDTLARLDRLEGHPKWYKRSEIMISMENGRSLKCWLYFNITEKSEGNKLHKTYTQGIPKQMSVFEDTIEEEEDEDSQYFCVSCLSSLDHDPYDGCYYCHECQEYYTKTDAIKF